MSEQNYRLPPMGETQSNKSNMPKKILPVIVVLGAIVLLWVVMGLFKPEIEKKSDEKIVPAVETIQITAIDFIIPIKTEGMVLPKTKINISAEVLGKIVYVSDKFTNGGVFKEGDVLIKIDPVDYQLAITRAKANVAAQVANLDLQQAKSDLAKTDWKKYGKKGKPNALNLNLPQVASAKAALSGAKADLNLATRNLDKTIVKAPFNGVMLSKNVDLGQFVNIGVALAGVASTQVAEIRVSLSDEQLSMSGLDQFDSNSTIQVVIGSQEIPGQQWRGKVSAVEAQRDARTLFNYAVVQVELPFTQQASALRFNTFVEVAFKGKTLKDVFRLSRSYVMLNNRVKVLDDQSSLQIKSVEVVYSDEDNLYIANGLNEGDKIITTQLPSTQIGSKLNLENSTGQ